LLEPSRTNVLSNNSSIKQNFGTTVTSSISPEGIANAFKISETATTAQHFSTFGDANVVSGTVYTISFYIKKGTENLVRFYTNTAQIDSNIKVNFDENTTILAGGGIVAGSDFMQQVGNGWYRVGYSATAQASANMIVYAVVKDLSSYAGNTNNYTEYYGVQVEAGSYATSLIHTSGSTVTRSADAANNAGNSDLINSTEGVLYAEIKALANDGTSRHFSINDGTAANKVEIYYDSTTNEINGHINVSGASSALFSQTFATVLEYHKVAVKYKANDFSMFVDGAQIATDTSGVVFPANTLNNLAFDKGNATLDFYADVKSVMVFKEALTDLELEKLTGYNNHELYMNYYNRLSYLGLAEEYNVESDINNYIL
jgi:hypothetical protein